MIINQPRGKQLGMQLIEAIQSGQYKQLTVMVAYARLSGVYRISPYITTFRKNGGEVRFIVGIDQQNTSYDALCYLSKIVNSLFVFHSESITQTFHMKCYWLKSEDTCWYSIGSNNLTAGGLFTNYELSTAHSLSGIEAISVNDELESIYQAYSDPKSSCSHEINDTFLSLLLKENYVGKELPQRRELANKIKYARTFSQKNRLFGMERFSPPQISNHMYDGKQINEDMKHHRKQSLEGVASITDEYENNYLIRMIPRAGNRSKQVHFTIDLLKNYFCLAPGDDIFVQQMHASGDVGEIEERKIVFSKKNKNVKIELTGALMLNTNYPEDTNTRPILILKRINPRFFVYMIILPGDLGYDVINVRLQSITSGKALPYEVIDESSMFELWSDCPIT